MPRSRAECCIVIVVGRAGWFGSNLWLFRPQNLIRSTDDLVNQHAAINYDTHTHTPTIDSYYKTYSIASAHIHTLTQSAFDCQSDKKFADEMLSRIE
jgi:hypothetical protein